MKRPVLFALVFGLFAAAPVTATFAAEPSAACLAKRTSIETQLAEATAQKRKQEISGLQKALKANKANCTDASLARERDRDIKKAQQKVAERERSLAEAQRKGDAKKIADRQEKLDAARRALAVAEKPIGS